MYMKARWEMWTGLVGSGLAPAPFRQPLPLFPGRPRVYLDEQADQRESVPGDGGASELEVSP